MNRSPHTPTESGSVAIENAPAAENSQPASSCCSHRRSIAALLVLAGLIVAILAVWTVLKGPSSPRRTAGTASFGADGKIESKAGRNVHPLEPALAFAREVTTNMTDNVRDYTATILKQERIGANLKPEEVCYVKIRHEPFSAYMKFLAPENQKDTEAIYVEGANDGKLIGHAGSGLKKLIGAVKLPPMGPIAMLDQHYPITELGIANLAKRLIEVGEKDMQFGQCHVWWNDNAKVGDRPCTSITVMHPEKRPEFLFHIARIFVDKELKVPLHYEAYDWPQKPGDPPGLIERYTYTRLKLNPGLTDADFDPKNPEYEFVSK